MTSAAVEEVSEKDKLETIGNADENAYKAVLNHTIDVQNHKIQYVSV